MDEIWKDIVGYEGLYQISSKGKVRSFHHGCNELVPKKNNKGYLWVDLRKRGAQERFLVHRLVAIHFLDNSHNYPIINHKDENPLNNNIYNLEWCDNSYNVKYFLQRHMRKKTPRRKGYKRSCGYRAPGVPYKNNEKILQHDMNGNVVMAWSSGVRIRHKLGYNEYSIRQCCLGNRKTAYGFKWTFA